MHGLVALMEIQASRMRARSGPDGEPVLLVEQNRALWDRVADRSRARIAGARGEALAQPRGFYLLQAAIAACHARAVSVAETDWKKITALYAELARVAPSPVIELNRAVAVAMAHGPEAGLALADQLAAEGSLRSYHLLPSVRARSAGPARSARGGACRIPARRNADSERPRAAPAARSRQCL